MSTPAPPRRFAAWRTERILNEEARPALYGYSQTYTVPGIRRGSRAPRLHRPRPPSTTTPTRSSTATSRPSPSTSPTASSLFKATRAYCEQIYMLYSDPAFTAEKLIFEQARRADLAITDEYGVVHASGSSPTPHSSTSSSPRWPTRSSSSPTATTATKPPSPTAKERAAQLKLPLNQPRDEDEKLTPSALPVPPFPKQP